MFKFISPLTFAATLIWAGSVSAAPVQIRTGLIDNDEYGGTVQQFGFGDFGGGSGRFRVDYTGPVAPLSAEVNIRYRFDVVYYDTNDNYTGSWYADYDQYVPVTLTANGFIFEVETMANTRRTTGYPDSSNPYGIPGVTEAYFYSWENMLTDVYYSDVNQADPPNNPAAAGKPFELRVTAVPEPATWAMMIVGFGLTGAALRGRRLLAMQLL